LSFAEQKTGSIYIVIYEIIIAIFSLNVKGFLQNILARVLSLAKFLDFEINFSKIFISLPLGKIKKFWGNLAKI
jgi:hypothetical protein